MFSCEVYDFRVEAQPRVLAVVVVVWNLKDTALANGVDGILADEEQFLRVKKMNHLVFLAVSQLLEIAHHNAYVYVDALDVP